MSFMIVFAAAVPAYLAGGVALLMGAGWLMSLAVLSGTGVALTLLLSLVALSFRMLRRPEHGKERAQLVR